MARELDVNYSARPLAEEIAKEAPNEHILAEVGVKRDIDYGLAFYRNQPTVHYDHDGVPAEEHILVIPSNDEEALQHYLAGRIYEPLFLYETQGLSVYKVFAKQMIAVAPPPRAGESIEDGGVAENSALD